MSANSKLGEKLLFLQKQNFTGMLTINSAEGKQWKLYFYLGKFLWAKGGLHPNRSWQRHLKQFCPNINTRISIIKDKNKLECLKYYILIALLQKKAIDRQQVKNLTIIRTKEIFFDLLQQEYKNALSYDTQSYSARDLLKAGFNISLAVINLEQTLFKAQQEWATWGSKGLASCSPNHAPLLKNYADLRNQIPDIIFNNMSRLLNGQKTLRDLSFKMDKDIIEVTCGIVPYFFKGYLRLLEIPDISE